jgi:hypothetical protein
MRANNMKKKKKNISIKKIIFSEQFEGSENSSTCRIKALIATEKVLLCLNKLFI